VKLKDLLRENYNNYLDENKYIHRWQDINSTIKLLKNKRLSTTKPFISLTLDPDSAKSAGFSGILITFDRNNLQKNNSKMQEVYYEEHFMKLFPNISRYVTGYRKKEDYDDDELNWEQYIETFEDEQEVVIPKSIKIDDNSIVLITAKNSDKNNLKQFENKYKIKYQ